MKLQIYDIQAKMLNKKSITQLVTKTPPGKTGIPSGSWNFSTEESYSLYFSTSAAARALKSFVWKYSFWNIETLEE